jgi:serine protease
LRLLLLLTLAAVAAALPAPASAVAQDTVPGQVVVQYDAGASSADQQAAQQASGAAPIAAPAAQIQVLQVAPGSSVSETAAQLRSQPGVRYAVPNVVAHASAFVPNDRGKTRFGAGWQQTQWNFLSPAGVDAPGAWANLIAAGAPGGAGVTVAVLDTGVAYEDRGRFRRSPDLAPTSFASPRDLVSRDAHPDDLNGHGTFVASVIAERTNNGFGVTGLAYGARIMPVRVLDSQGLGDAATIAAGVRYAAAHGARVLNLSLEFDSSVPASQIPEVLSALRYAKRKGVLAVAASGNESLRSIAYPARANDVLSVGATTEHLCQADYSNDGPGLDLVAPGGGADADIPSDPAHCRPDDRAGHDIFQVTFAGSVRRFGLPGGYEGTSMASPHVAAVAALIIASGVIGRRPSPDAVEARLKATARDLGAPGADRVYGAGLVNAAAATTPSLALAGRWKRAAAKRRIPH